MGFQLSQIPGRAMHENHLISIEKSQTLLINEQSRLLESQGRNIYKFGFGQSPFSPPSFVQKALQDNTSRHEYSSVQGLLPLREAAARFHNAQNNLNFDAAHVIVGPGSKTLIYCIMACFEAVEVLIPAPAWVSYAPQATMLGHAITRIPCSSQDRWHVTASTLTAAIKSRKRPEVPLLMILNTPGNPDGLSYSRAELEALAEVMRQHNVLVIADEIYAQLHHDGAHVSLAECYPEGSIVTTGLSKWCGAGGWRLGLALLPSTFSPAFTDTLLGVASEVYSCAPTPVQLAATVAYNGGTATLDYIRHQQRILKALGKAVQQPLVDAGMNVHAPDGGFYLFVDFTAKEDALARMGIYDSDAVCRQLLEDAGVALLPSTAFGLPSSHLSARLAYVDFDGDAAIAASESIGLDNPLPDDFLQRHCRHTLDGAYAMAQWVKELKAVRYA